MIIRYEGADYEFNADEITVKQAIKIEKFMGCTFAEWGERVEKGADLQSLQVAGWLILHGGRDVPIEDTDFAMVKFGQAFTEAAEAEAAAEKAAEAEDPTSAAAANGATSPALLTPAAAAATPSRPSSAEASL